MTDRDIVVKCIAEGKDPNDVTAAELAQGKPVTIGADDSAEEPPRTMAKYQVRRLPVIDGHQLVGIVAQADVARALPNEVVGKVLFPGPLTTDSAGQSMLAPPSGKWAAGRNPRSRYPTTPTP